MYHIELTIEYCPILVDREESLYKLPSVEESLYVKGWSVKTLSQAHWESCFESVKAIELQLADLREALPQVGEIDNDAAIAVAKDVHLEIAIQEIKNLIKYFKEYREKGFSKAIDEAREIASEMDIDLLFIQKRIIKRKKNRKDESSSSEEVAFTVEENFRKLTNIKDEDLKSSCYHLEDALKFEGSSDIDDEALYMELKLFHASLTNKFSNPIDVLEHMKEEDYFPEACIAYRILLTIPVTVASAERRFSKLKLLKSYLRSTMSQDRLSGLAMIAIENEVLDNLNCE
ncbi:uncharacterized protein LOC110875706 [Helianthus annuus]|uniref:uncharacterized protein LOC110875706 n=1 Tax=Helianthus annuus TaxID=4232 RepID=UPI000B905A6F|nr:uncharacterized protein LOC110875706 [Helianthus annuus]